MDCSWLLLYYFSFIVFDQYPVAFLLVSKCICHGGGTHRYHCFLADLVILAHDRSLLYTRELTFLLLALLDDLYMHPASVQVLLVLLTKIV